MSPNSPRISIPFAHSSFPLKKMFLLPIAAFLLLLLQSISTLPVQLSQTPSPTGFILFQQQNAPISFGKHLIGQQSACPPCPLSPTASPPIFYSPQLQIPAPPILTSPCPPTGANALQKRVKRGCCCCCKPCCCCCCCKPCCCGCALNICVKPSCCCKCCPTCCCCPGYGCKKRRKRALPLSPLIESMPMLTSPFGQMKWQKRG